VHAQPCSLSGVSVLKLIPPGDGLPVRGSRVPPRFPRRVPATRPHARNTVRRPGRVAGLLQFHLNRRDNPFCRVFSSPPYFNEDSRFRFGSRLAVRILVHRGCPRDAGSVRLIIYWSPCPPRARPMPHMNPRVSPRCSVHPALTAAVDPLEVTITTTAVETISKPGYVNYQHHLRNPEMNIEKIYPALRSYEFVGPCPGGPVRLGRREAMDVMLAGATPNGRYQVPRQPPITVSR